jgi:hypothetical protein
LTAAVQVQVHAQDSVLQDGYPASIWLCFVDSGFKASDQACLLPYLLNWDWLPWTQGRVSVSSSFLGIVKLIGSLSLDGLLSRECVPHKDLFRPSSVSGAHPLTVLSI